MGSLAGRFHPLVARMLAMGGNRRRLFCATYTPLVATKAGRDACEHYGLPPFIDGSIRREPDLEHAYPSISCLCRAGKFAPRLREHDVVVYWTKKARYGTPIAHRRLTAILRVLQVFESHADAAAWYRDRGLPLPSNCLVPGNPPNPVSRTHRRSQHSHLKGEDEFVRRWELGYQARARRFGCFLACEPLLTVTLGWDAPIVHDEVLTQVFGHVPATQNPGALNTAILPVLLERLGIDVPPSCR